MNLPLELWNTITDNLNIHDYSIMLMINKSIYENAIKTKKHIDLKRFNLIGKQNRMFSDCAIKSTLYGALQTGFTGYVNMLNVNNQIEDVCLLIDNHISFSFIDDNHDKLMYKIACKTIPYGEWPYKISFAQYINKRYPGLIDATFVLPMEQNSCI